MVIMLLFAKSVGPGHCHFDFAQDILFNPQDTEDKDEQHDSRF